MAKKAGADLMTPGKARVGVILTPPRPIPRSWDDRRMCVNNLWSANLALIVISLPDWQAHPYRMTPRS